jgi:hypothetical protein
LTTTSSEQTSLAYPTRDELLKEYEFCQKAALSLEETIWQTSAIMGVGIIGTFLYIGTRSGSDQPSWEVAGIVGLFSFFVSLTWWLVARRWWSVQHSLFMRMRHIEEKLGLHAHRYIKYLDDPSTIPTSDLTEKQIFELKRRSVQKGLFKLYLEHQRFGVQSVLKLFPIITIIAWATYTIWLYSQTNQVLQVK